MGGGVGSICIRGQEQVLKPSNPRQEEVSGLVKQRRTPLYCMQEGERLTVRARAKTEVVNGGWKWGGLLWGRW